MKNLKDECLAYRKYGQNVHPLRVEEMIDEAFRSGYERAIHNYCEPYINK